MSMKIRFSDIKKVPRSEPLPEAVNAKVKNVIRERIGNEDLLDLFEMAEKNRWFGRLRFGSFVFVFRFGVCQSFTREIEKGAAVFEMNVMNDSVEFGKDKA
jgi:hypothetical protein